MATTVSSTSNTSDSSESISDGGATSPTSESPSPVQTTSKDEETSAPANSKEAEIVTAPPSSPSTEEKRSSITCNASLKRLSIVVVIGTGIISVIVHLLVCWYCQRRHNISHHSMKHYRIRQPARRKRRKLRKKPAFMQIPLQSSSDCSI